MVTVIIKKPVSTSLGPGETGGSLCDGPGLVDFLVPCFLWLTLFGYPADASDHEAITHWQAGANDDGVHFNH